MEYRLENWCVVVGEVNPYQPPEMCTQHLAGEVYGHPNFTDGEKITTSRIVLVERDGDRVVAVTGGGSRYLLGAVDPAYEAEFPNAKERLGRPR